MFDLNFLSCFFTKIGSFCAHWRGNFLNFPKLTLLLSLVQFWCPLWPLNKDPPFFWDILYVFTDHENTNICLVTQAPWVHHLSKDIYFSIFLWSVRHTLLIIQSQLHNFIPQVPHYLHSLCPLCHPGLSQRKANLWRGRSGEKEKSYDKQKNRNG